MQNINIQSDFMTMSRIMKRSAHVLILIAVMLSGCKGQAPQTPQQNKTSASSEVAAPAVVVGAQQLDVLLPKLKDKLVALVVNNTSLVGNTHLADTLKSSG